MSVEKSVPNVRVVVVGGGMQYSECYQHALRLVFLRRVLTEDSFWTRSVMADINPHISEAECRRKPR